MLYFFCCHALTAPAVIDSVLLVQIKLARRLPLCYATLLGTHNSGINLADGYGNLDEQFQEYFKWIKWVVRPSDFPLSQSPSFLLISFELICLLTAFIEVCTVCKSLSMNVQRAVKTGRV